MWPCSGSGRHRQFQRSRAPEIGTVEIVIGAGIDHDLRQRAAAAGAIDHLSTGRRRRDVVLGADQKQRRHPCAPAEPGREPAIRIERDRRAEIRLAASVDSSCGRTAHNRALAPFAQPTRLMRSRATQGCCNSQCRVGVDVGHPLLSGDTCRSLTWPRAPSRPQATAVSTAPRGRPWTNRSAQSR